MKDIQASVGRINGRHCFNRIPDQLIVMDLLNRIPLDEGGALKPGGVPETFRKPLQGICQDDLHSAILAFQRKHIREVLFADGHIDPGERTIRAMNRLAAIERPAITVSSQFTLFFFDEFGTSNLTGLVSAMNATSSRISEYRFVPAPFASVLREMVSRDRSQPKPTQIEFATPEPVTTDAFDGPVSAAAILQSEFAFVFQFHLTVRLSGGRLGRVTTLLPVDGARKPPSAAFGEMKLVPSPTPRIRTL